MEKISRERKKQLAFILAIEARKEYNKKYFWKVGFMSIFRPNKFRQIAEYVESGMALGAAINLK